VLGGIVLSLLAVSLIVFIDVPKNKYLTFVFLIGIGLAVKGIIDFKDMLKMKEEYNEKFGRYLSALSTDKDLRYKQ
jgi:uncharacterized membrane protein HdeD (DUF308 family)